LLTRPIPSTGEPLPIIGCGTYPAFDVSPRSADVSRLAEVLAALFDAGGSVIDTSPMYGRAEDIVGRLLQQSSAHSKAFLATKVWTRGRATGIEQMQRSFKLLQTDRIDLMQVHNLVDWRTHLDTLAGWKADGRVGHIGVTHYTSSAFDDLAHAMENSRVDFVQLNYSLDDRAAEKRLLPLAKERGIAVLVNRPFGGGSLIRSLAKKPVPDFAASIGCTSWPELLLTFVISHPVVTCVIPGTSNPDHMTDAARSGASLDPTAREKILNWWSSR